MSGKASEVIACPACGTELSLEHLMSHLDDEQAFARLVALSVPMAHLVVLHIGLFAPEKQRLTLRKKVRLIAQLLPDLRREAITHKGRDWLTPRALWEQAIEQMLAARDAGTLAVPLKGHGYLYAVLASLAGKKEAQQESRREAERRSEAQAPRGTVSTASGISGIGIVLESVYGGSYTAMPDAAKAPKVAPGVPAEHRMRIAEILGKAPKAQKPEAEAGGTA
jgi:hypothetical protein